MHGNMGCTSFPKFIICSNCSGVNRSGCSNGAHHPLNACDHDHMTSEETRLLPIGGDGNVIVCRFHHSHEMAFRRSRIREGVEYDLPKWEDLAVYAEAAPIRHMGGRFA